MLRRSIVHDPIFDDALADLFFGFIREGDAYVEAAEDLLSVSPEIGTKQPSGVWILPMQPIREQTVYLFYTFDESVVLLLGIATFAD